MEIVSLRDNPDCTNRGKEGMGLHGSGGGKDWGGGGKKMRIGEERGKGAKKLLSFRVTFSSQKG